MKVFDNRYSLIGGGVGVVLAQIAYTPINPTMAIPERVGASVPYALLGAGVGAFVWWLRLKKFPQLSHTRVLGLSVLFLLVSMAAGWAWLSQPRDYDECILKYMKGAAAPEAARAIEKSCRVKFPEACYAWQKAMQKHGLFADLMPGLDVKYGLPRPIGCAEVLDVPQY